MKTTSLLITLLLFLSWSAKNQSFDPKLATALQNTIDSIRIATNTRGISACVMFPGKETWKGVSGFSYDGVLLTPEMEFGIASNTKLFTGVLLLKLAEHKLIHLDDALYKWLPPFQNIDSNITIRQLLNHTSGLADVNNIAGYPDSVLSNPNRIFTPAEVMTWVGPPLFAAGTGWDYSNTNYLLAGMIAESATGRTYGQLLRDSILSPLKLDSSFLDVYERISVPIAHPWQGGIDKNSTPRKALNSISWAAGGMYSTSGEMAQWYHALMNGHVLLPDSFDEMTRFVGSGNYGIGLFETKISGRTVWYHGGSIWGGYNSTMMYDRNSGVVICVLINQNPGQAFQLAKELLSVILSYTLVKSENHEQGSNLKWFPNPSLGNVSFHFPDQHIKSVKIFSSSGTFLQEFLSEPISIGHLPKGLYYIHTQTDSGCYTDKLIKQE